MLYSIERCHGDTYDGRAGAPQGVAGLQGEEGAVGGGALLGGMGGPVEGLPQQVVQTPMGAIVLARGDLQQIW